MLELPERAVVAAQLSDTVAGKTISGVEVSHSPHGFAFFTGDTAAYSAMLCGKTVDAVYPLAGQIELAAGDARLVLNDGVNARWLPEGTPPPAKHQLLIEFERGGAVVCTVQMYGGMTAFRDGTYENKYYFVAKEKPTPYEDGFTQAYFDSIVRDAPGKLSAKGLLATEQRIPGLGNGCAQDILFNARINPQSAVRALSDADLARLYRAVVDTLAAMRGLGGRDTERDLFGNTGRYATVLSSKTYTFPCPACGGVITRKAYMGGNVYFCAACQPVVK